MKEKLYQKAVSIIGSKKFFYLILLLFGLQAAWIAVSGVFPMAFDEDYHFGLIQLYSHHLLPFIGHEPTSAYAYGAVTRDPSYMYHYLMSFPYRLINLFIHNTMTQIIILRFIDIGFFAIGIVGFRKLLIRLKLSKALTHVSLLFFILIPITTLLAAQINYDNLLFLLTPITFILVIDFTKALQIKKRLTVTLFVGWLALGCFASLVMYTFLPLFFSQILFMTFVIVSHYKGNIGKALAAFLNDFKKLSKFLKIALIAIIVLSLGLFIERDVVNTLKYGTPTPECNQVLGIGPCSNFGSWERNYRLSQTKGTYPHKNTLQFTRSWVHTMFYNLLYAINGINSQFYALPPLPLPETAAAVVAILGIGLIVLFRRKIFTNNPTAQLFIFSILIFTIILWLQNYSDYLHLDAVVGVNGRYLVPILPLILGLIGMAFSQLLRKRQIVQPILVLLVVLLFLNGGGVETFIIRSDSSWDWHNSSVVRANNDVRNVIKPITLGSKFSL